MKKKIDSAKYDQLFRNAVRKAAEEKGAEFLEDAKDYHFEPSPGFQEKVKASLEPKAKRKWQLPGFLRPQAAWGNAIGWALMVLVLSFLIVPSIASAGKWVSKLISEENPVFVRYFVEQTNEDGENENVIYELPEGAYFPAYVPEGFRLYQNDVTPFGAYYLFIDDNENYFDVRIMSLNAGININNEKLDEKSVEIINGYEADYYSREGTNSLLWTDNKHIFEVSGRIPKAEILKVAHSIIPKP